MKSSQTRRTIGRITGSLAVMALLLFLSVQTAVASPFGQGTFGADVPFGSATSLTISLGSDVSLALQPDGPHFSGTGSHTVTVTSTDVVGYVLYAHTTGSSDMVNGSAVISASSNTIAAPLTVDSWGFNTTGSTTDFVGMGATSTLLKDATGPYKNGDDTTITYGVRTDASKEAGTYTTAVTYTAVAKNQ